jgi:TonB family protein
MINVEVNFRLYGKGGEQPAGAPSPSAAAGQDANTLFANASSAHAMNDCGSAIPLAIRVTETYPLHNGAWNLLGLCYLELDELPKAEDAFKRSIESSPRNEFAYNNLGRVYARQRNYDMAVVQFRKQIEINSRDRYAHMNLAESLRLEKKCDQAIPEYQLAAQLTPDNAGPHTGLARCYFDHGQNDSGMADLNNAAALTSTGPAWNVLAWTLAERNLQLDRAEQYAKLAISMESSSLAAVSLDPLTPGAYGRTRALAAGLDTLGWVLYLRGDFTSAEKNITAAWTLSRSPTSCDHLAQLSEKLGRQDDSLKYSALTIARGEVLSEAQESDGDAVANSKARLVRLAPSPATLNQVSQDAQRLLDQEDSFELPNPAKRMGSAEFALLRAYGQRSAKARWMDGDPSLRDFEGEIADRVPVGPPDIGAVDLLRWGALSCEKPDAQCKFRLSSARDAVYAQLRSSVKTPPAAIPQTKAAINPAASTSGPISTPGTSAKQVQVGQTVSQGLLIYQVSPTYPPAARQARVQGTVVLQAVIGKDGSVEELQVFSGHPLLIQAAMDAVKQWRYKPYVLMGEPVEVQTTINVNFTLQP